MDKNQLRKTLKSKRKNLDDSEYRRASASIMKLLTDQEEYEKAEMIHCYVSINQRKEVDTHGLIQFMLNAGKDVAVPVTEFEDRTLRHVRLQSFDDLEPNEWNVLEPVNGKEVSVEELELVIVPMLGGDLEKNRIGYGKGFYDRFLSQVCCPALGLTYEDCIVEKGIPVDDHDVPLTKIITEQRVIL